MPSLLDLPREIRDEILDFVLSFKVDVPMKTTRRRRDDRSRWLDGHHVFMPSSEKAFCSSTYTLLRTCKQLHAETMDHVTKSDVKFVLDLALIDLCWLLPTWRVILPRTSTLLDEVIVNLTLATSDYAEQTQHGWSLRSSQDPFWGFIHRFLVVGPVGDVQNDTKDLGIRVKCLTVNAHTITHIAGRHMFSEDEIPIRTIDGMGHLNHDRLWSFTPNHRDDGLFWIESIARQIFTDLWEYDVRPAMKCVQERVGKVVFNFDQQLKATVDLADIVSKDRDAYPDAHRAITREIRKQNGL